MLSSSMTYRKICPLTVGAKGPDDGDHHPVLALRFVRAHVLIRELAQTHRNVCDAQCTVRPLQ